MPAPGCFWTGTLTQYRGTWREVRGARFTGTGITPIKRDVALSVNTSGIDGIPRTSILWVNESSNRFATIGTAEGIWVVRLSVDPNDVIEITAPTFTPGSDPDLWHISYSEEIAGPYAIFEGEGVLYKYNTAAPMEPAINAPSGYGVVCSYIPGNPPIVLRANGQDRLIAWPDNEDHTVWAPDTDNNAGDLQIDAGSELMAGRTFFSTVLIWSKTDLHVGEFVNGEYAFREVGKCRLAGPNSIAVTESGVFWLGVGEEGHIEVFSYDGSSIRNIPCSVDDLVQQEILATLPMLTISPQIEDTKKIFAQWKPSRNEIWWWLTAHSSRQYAVVYNYALGIWFTGYHLLSSYAYLSAAPEGVVPWGLLVGQNPSSSGVFLRKDELDETYETMLLITNIVEADPGRYTCVNEVYLDLNGESSRDLQVEGYSKDTPIAEDLTFVGRELVTDVFPSAVSLGRFTPRWKGIYGMQIQVGISPGRGGGQDTYRFGRMRIMIKPGAARR